MLTTGASFTSDFPDGNPVDGVAPQSSVMPRPLFVRSCGRLGRTANPPRFSFADLFRPGRRRWQAPSALLEPADSESND
jgi:hypothetical protein